MTESWESRLWRWLANCYPAYRVTGARIQFIAADFQQVTVRLPCNWRTKNHMGITWGGSLYSCLDPVYALMLNKILGWEYRVIDSAAEITFIKPGRSTLYAHFQLTDHQLTQVRASLKTQEKVRLQLHVALLDRNGVCHVKCRKSLQIDHKKSR